MGETDETDVVIIGSGFGGSVAALRFAEAKQRVVVLERGDRVTREKFQADLDFFWNPHRNSYGMHDLRARGKQVIPWIAAAVGGGSHVYAGTLKRRLAFDDFPSAIQQTEMAPYYAQAEGVLGGAPYPTYAPYNSVRAVELMLATGKIMKERHPNLVEDYGRLPLGISFAPEGGTAGAAFTNVHGCEQRYYDPTEQSILGGDIDTKNSLDRNYLYLAEKAGAQIRPLCEADRIERLADGRYRVTYYRYQPASGFAAVRLRWMTLRPRAARTEHSIVAARVVVAAGAVGSTELLLRNRDLHKTLPELSAQLGQRYTTNGDFLTLIIPFRGLFVSWLGFGGMLGCLFTQQWVGLAVAAFAYYLGLVISPRVYDPDVGTTNSDHIRFKGLGGETHGVYIESGRYPTPGQTLAAIIISSFTNNFHPRLYRTMSWIARVVGTLIPPFGALARTYPIPLLSMGRDHAYGTFRLEEGSVVIDYDLAANKAFYAYLEKLGRLIAKAANAYWLPNVLMKISGKQEVPHNQGGVPMGEKRGEAVVDHAGRVFGYPNLMVLDGSIIPVSIGPNPALTITAIAERAMAVNLAQLARDQQISAEG